MIQSEALENTNTSKLPGNLQEKLLKAPNKYTSQTTKTYWTNSLCNISNDFELSTLLEEVVKKVFSSLDSSKVSGLDGIPAKFWKGNVVLLASSLGNVNNLSIKL